ncbi:hypothetical protein [Pseudomonas nitroreducens]|uniref:hypothetical protein n=1 Tax=Pseudomonas nitroreducens TaxID=46680 RepID=UPI00265A00F1|nr:hypothetical protein [Pseudomonas nitroreducens]MCP1651422.1 hypothetical protein [Pseudomonas nitroreducens]MCP1689352.1 hypothetical protein [Pseudomonas nitroreducens]
MLRRLRLFIILWLSLALPLTGMAGFEAPAEPCPMQEQGMSQMAGMDQDCCQDAGKMTPHGKKACKSGQECKTSSLLQVSLLNAAQHPAATQIAPRYNPLVLSQAPADLWRPPCA